MTRRTRPGTSRPRSRGIGRRSSRGGRAGSGAGWFDPASLLVCSRQVRVGEVWASTLVVTGYPSQVGAGWLEPLTGHPGMVDVSVHLRALDPEVSTNRLRRRLARLESGRRAGALRGALADYDVEAATEDAHVMMAQLARGTTRLFEVTLTITVHARSRAELAEEVASLRSVASSLLITAREAAWRAAHGWMTGLPGGPDRVDTGRILDTATVSAAFPFSSPDLPSTLPSARGVLYGANLSSSSLVWWDRWAAPNHNQVILGSSGSGKSYFVKAQTLRELYAGTHISVLDPEDEYVRLAERVGGTVIRAGSPGVRINPLELPVHLDPVTGRRSAAPDTLVRRRLFLQAFLSVALTDATGPDASPIPGAAPALGHGLSGVERSVLDSAITSVYSAAGITDDPSTWTRPAPLLSDLRAVLERAAHPAPPVGRADQPAEDSSREHADDDHHRDPGDRNGDRNGTGDGSVADAAAGLATRLEPFTGRGAWGALFDGPSTIHPSGHLIVWALRELPDQVRPLAMLLVLDAIWRTVTQPERRPRLVVIDEAWTMLAHPAAARFLLRVAKSARKYWAGLALITQDVADVLGSDLGRAVVTNADTAVLLGQAPQALPEIGRTFALSAGETRFLQGADRGQALLVSGGERVALHAVVSPGEDALITTDPRQLAAAGAHEPAWVDLDPPAGQPPAGQPLGPSGAGRPPVGRRPAGVVAGGPARPDPPCPRPGTPSRHPHVSHGPDGSVRTSAGPNGPGLGGGADELAVEGW